MKMFDANIGIFAKLPFVIAGLIICSIIDSALIVGQAIGLAKAITLLWLGKSLETILWFVVCFALCFIVRHLLKLVRDRRIDAWAHTQSAWLLQQSVEQISKLGPAFIQKHGLGSSSTLLSQGSTEVQSYLKLLLPKLADLFVIPLLLAVVLFTQDWISGVIAVVLLPIVILYMQMLGANTKEAAQTQHKKYMRMGNHFVDSLRGLETLKNFGRARAYAQEIFRVSENFREATVKTLQSAFLSSLLLDLFRTFALAAIATMLGFRLIAGDIELFPALMALILVPEYFGAIRRYADDFHASLDGRNRLAEFKALLDEPVPERYDIQIEPWSATSTLELCSVSASYPGEEMHLALNEVSLCAHGFEHIGVVGQSGSGKSTLSQLLAGFLCPAQGHFTIDGNVLSTLNCKSWQEQVSYIPQNPHIFTDTLRNNITFYNPAASDKDILAACETLGLNELIAALPRGLDTVIGEGGTGLSGGQAQRISLARALLNNKCKIIIFDEPTAHLDIETEYELKEKMLPLLQNHLVFFATHRLHWLNNMDRVLVLEDGRVVTFDTPQKVLPQLKEMELL